MIRLRHIPLITVCLTITASICQAASGPWGHLRTVTTPVAVMSARSIESDVNLVVQPGEWIRVDYKGNNWAAVFEKHASRRDESHAIGYAYTPLLKPYSHYMQNIWEPAVTNRHDPRVSLSEEYCKLDYFYDQKALLTIVPQLSRVRQPHTEDLPDMLRRRTIRVLTTYAPSTYFISRGQGYGFEYQLLKDYEKQLNRIPIYGKLPIVFEFIPVPENLLIPCLKSGIGDIVAAGVRQTALKDASIDFTIPYLKSVSEVVVVNSMAPPIKRIEDLSGRTIYIQPGWENSKTLRRINARLLIRSLPPMRVVKANGILNSEDILALLNAGIIELTLAESHIAHVWAEMLPNLKIHELPEISEHTPIVWMVRKANPELQASLNQFLLNRRRGSHFGNIYYRQYFKQTRWINNPLAPTDHAKFSRYAPLFRKYGAQYGFDWMLLAAIAYQESEMNHYRRSRSGALGLMQVLPSTSAGNAVNIHDISEPENNVHAGAKYLAVLRDVYFSDPDILPHDRIRFILAAYNAGPNRIQRCRRLAARFGYDPNQWFHHTEIAAMRLIGSETVRYVANVKRYYLAYSLGHIMECLRAQHMEALKSKASPPRQAAADYAIR